MIHPEPSVLWGLASAHRAILDADRVNNSPDLIDFADLSARPRSVSEIHEYRAAHEPPLSQESFIPRTLSGEAEVSLRIDMVEGMPNDLECFVTKSAEFEQKAWSCCP